MANIVVFGGGSGLSHILRTIKQLDHNLTVVVTISDDGGSTGKIRDYYDIPAPGDLRRVVLSLSEHRDLEKLMNYRFDDKLEKHTIGNLILAALTDIKGDISSAVKEYCNLLDVKEEVLPLSNESLKLIAQMKSGKLVYGEHAISSHPEEIADVFYDQNAKANPEVLSAIKNADYILFSCGSLFTSLLCNIALEDVIAEINNCKAKVIYISNLVTQKGETDSYTLANHINQINRHLQNERVDIVLANNNFDVDEEILYNYEQEGSRLVKIDEVINCKPYYDDFVTIKNGHIRHNIDKIKVVLEKVIKDCDD